MGRLVAAFLVAGLALAFPRPSAAQEFILAWGAYGIGPGQFDRPVAVAVNSVGEVYVGDSRQPYLQRFSPNGAFLGQCTIGPIPIANSIAIDKADRVIVGDLGQYAIRVYSSDLSPIVSWGAGAYGIAVGLTGDLYLAEAGRGTVSRWTIDGTFLDRWGGGPGAGPGQFSNAWAIAVDGSGSVYVADYGNSRVQKFSSNGEFITMWGAYGSGDGQFIFPTNIGITASGTILVADPYNNRIEEFTANGSFISAWGSTGQGPGQFSEPYGVAAFGADVYVADAGNSRIQKFGYLPTPTQTTTWGRLKALYR